MLETRINLNNYLTKESSLFFVNVRIRANDKILMPWATAGIVPYVVRLLTSNPN